MMRVHPGGDGVEFEMMRVHPGGDGVEFEMMRVHPGGDGVEFEMMRVHPGGDGVEFEMMRVHPGGDGVEFEMMRVHPGGDGVEFEMMRVHPGGDGVEFEMMRVHPGGDGVEFEMMRVHPGGDGVEFEMMRVHPGGDGVEFEMMRVHPGGDGVEFEMMRVHPGGDGVEFEMMRVHPGGDGVEFEMMRVHPGGDGVEFEMMRVHPGGDGVEFEMMRVHPGGDGVEFEMMRVHPGGDGVEFEMMRVHPGGDGVEFEMMRVHPGGDGVEFEMMRVHPGGDGVEFEMMRVHPGGDGVEFEMMRVHPGGDGVEFEMMRVHPGGDGVEFEMMRVHPGGDGVEFEMMRVHPGGDGVEFEMMRVHPGGDGVEFEMMRVHPGGDGVEFEMMRVHPGGDGVEFEMMRVHPGGDGVEFEMMRVHPGGDGVEFEMMRVHPGGDGVEFEMMRVHPGGDGVEFEMMRVHPGGDGVEFEMMRVHPGGDGVEFEMMRVHPGGDGVEFEMMRVHPGGDGVEFEMMRVHPGGDGVEFEMMRVHPGGDGVEFEMMRVHPGGDGVEFEMMRVHPGGDGVEFEMMRVHPGGDGVEFEMMRVHPGGDGVEFEMMRVHPGGDGVEFEMMRVHPGGDGVEFEMMRVHPGGDGVEFEMMRVHPGGDGVEFEMMRVHPGGDGVEFEMMRVHPGGDGVEFEMMRGGLAKCCDWCLQMFQALYQLNRETERGCRAGGLQVVNESKADHFHFLVFTDVFGNRTYGVVVQYYKPVQFPEDGNRYQNVHVHWDVAKAPRLYAAVGICVISKYAYYNALKDCLSCLLLQLKSCRGTDFEDRVKEFAANVALVPSPPPGQLHLVKYPEVFGALSHQFGQTSGPEKWEATDPCQEKLTSKIVSFIAEDLIPLSVVFNMKPLQIVLPSREDLDSPVVDLDLHLPFLCFKPKQVLQETDDLILINIDNGSISSSSSRELDIPDVPLGAAECFMSRPALCVCVTYSLIFFVLAALKIPLNPIKTFKLPDFPSPLVYHHVQSYYTECIVLLSKAVSSVPPESSALLARYYYLRGLMNMMLRKRLDALSDFQNLYKTDIGIFPADLVKKLVGSLAQEEWLQAEKRSELKRFISKVKKDNETGLVKSDYHVKNFALPKKHMQLEDFVKQIQESGIVKDIGTIHRLFDALTVESFKSDFGGQGLDTVISVAPSQSVFYVDSHLDGQQKQIDPETFKVFYTFWKETEAEAQDVHLPAEVIEHLDKNESVYKLSCSVKTNHGDTICGSLASSGVVDDVTDQEVTETKTVDGRVKLNVPMMVPKTTSETLKHKINPSAGQTAPQAVDVLLYTPGAGECIMELRKNGMPFRRMLPPDQPGGIAAAGFSCFQLFIERDQLWTASAECGELCTWHVKDLSKPFHRIQLQDCTGVSCMIKVKNQIWVGSRGKSQGKLRGKIYVVDIEKHSVEKELVAHSAAVEALCSVEDRYVLSGSSCEDVPCSRVQRPGS
ncbi:UNVERIFIED_CONTAM: hypothetical protein FKN15_040122 [Acipenser sinensis]